MLVGVISDTHGNEEGLKDAIAYLNSRHVDLVIHCGDWTSPDMVDLCKMLHCPVVSVLGNCDLDKRRFRAKEDELEITFFEDVGFILLGEHNAGIYHGHDTQKLKDMVASGEYDVVFTGHTHCPQIFESGNMTGNTLLVNPGSLKAYSPNSFALYDSKTNKAKIVHLND